MVYCKSVTGGTELNIFVQPVYHISSSVVYSLPFIVQFAFEVFPIDVFLVDKIIG